MVWKTVLLMILSSRLIKSCITNHVRTIFDGRTKNFKSKPYFLYQNTYLIKRNPYFDHQNEPISKT
jgi:hypothetical protein